MGHFIRQCQHGKVLGQCRCPAREKTVRIVPCPASCTSADPAPVGWVIAGTGDALHEVTWVGDIYRTPEAAGAELAAARDEGRGGLRMYALYPVPEAAL